MGDLVARQSEVYNRMGRVVENLKKLGSARISAAIIRVQIEFLDKMWREFSDTHAQIVVLAEKDSTWQESEYFKDGFFDLGEEIYLDQQGTLRELLEKHEISAAAPPSDMSTSFSASRHDFRPCAALPRIDIPKFSGQVSEWPTFRDLFSLLVIRDEALTDIARFHYLRTSVERSALLRLRSLPITELNFKRAWDLLTERYENTRLLVNAQLGTFFSLTPATRDSADDLRRIIDTACDTVASFEAMGRHLTTPGDILVHLVVSKLDNLSRREWESQLGASTVPPTFDRLKAFIEARISTLESMQEVTNLTRASADRARSGARGARVMQTAAKLTTRQETCPLCAQGHFLLISSQFRRMEPAERLAFIRNRQLCLNCLGRHALDSCRSEKTCQRCKEKHHTSLHDAAGSLRQGSAVLSAAVPGQSASVVLATAKLLVHSADGRSLACRALVDPGSQVSLVCEDVVQFLNLSRKASSLPLFGIAGARAAVAREVSSFTITPIFGDQEPFKVTAFILPSLTNYKPIQRNLERLPAEFHNLRLADPDLQGRGSTSFWAPTFTLPCFEMACWSTRTRPWPSKIPLLAGFSSVRGKLTAELSSTPLNELVERFWRVEEVDAPQPSTAEDDFCEQHFRATHTRQPDGRYVIRLPLKPGLQLGESRHIAAERLHSLGRRFRRNPELRNEYAAFMHEYEQLGHMSPHSVFRYYLPYHCVVKAASATTKLRVVFNASQATSNGLSLNDVLYCGPNLLPDLVDILLKWRTHRIALVADIVKMYRQILVHPEDRRLQCVLWSSEVDSEPQDYQLCTVTYGMACAPFLAIRTLRQLALDHEAEFPRASNILRNDVYVDDILTGASSVEEAREVACELSRVCTAGCFPLQKWGSNCSEVFGDPSADSCNLELSGDEDSVPILGVQWCTKPDVFKVKVHSELLTRPTTKRDALSQLARLYDPIGWLAPVIIWAKFFMQDLWIDGCGWDALLSEARLKSWYRFQGELSELSTLKLPSWLQADSSTELHGFADASERAYAAVIYVRTISPEGKVKVVLLTARTKVALLKRVSLPRLELNAALLLCRLLHRVVRTLGWGDVPIHRSSDSTIVLHWVTSHSSRWKNYVANRTAEIQTAVPSAHWHHIVGNCNPADIASRGLTPTALPAARLWWDGPALLHDVPINYPTQVQADITEEQRVVVQVLTQSIGPEENPILARFSTLERLLRVTCWCIRWRFRADESRREPGISAAERNSALLRWVRIVQERHFAEELRQLKKLGSVQPNSRLSRLSPMLDAGNVLRIGGRLAQSLLSDKSKNPFVLPADSLFTELFIRAVHLRTLHGGTQLTLAVVRQ